MFRALASLHKQVRPASATVTWDLPYAVYNFSYYGLPVYIIFVGYSASRC